MVRIRDARKEKALTMKELAQKVGVVESTISMYENGKREPDYSTLVKIADVLNVSTDFLLCRSNTFLNNDSPIATESTPFDSSLVSQLCTAYNLNDKARAMIEMIIAMPPNECEIIAELAQRYASLLNRKEPEDENEPFRRAADQLTNDKKNDSITKAHA